MRVDIGQHSIVRRDATLGHIEGERIWVEWAGHRGISIKATPRDQATATVVIGTEDAERLVEQLLLSIRMARQALAEQRHQGGLR